MTYIDDIAAVVRRHTPDEVLPAGQPELDQLFRVYALLALSKRAEVGERDVHDAWSVWMLNQDADHKSVKPFDELSADVRAEDEPFVAAIRAAVAELKL